MQKQFWPKTYLPEITIQANLRAIFLARRPFDTADGVLMLRLGKQTS
jgi:hypothetical protein